MSHFRKGIASLCFLSLLWGGGSAADSSTSDALLSTQTRAGNVAEPKVIPAIFSALLSNLVTSGVQSLVGSLTNTSQPVANTGNAWNPNQVSTMAPCYANTTYPNKLTEMLRDELARAGCQLVTGFVGNMAQGITGNAPLVGSNLGQAQIEATQPLAFGTTGSPNYQGLKVSALIVNSSGQVVEERPVGSNFYSGERFRLRIQSTFPGFLEIMHTSPSGTTKRLFPRAEIGQFMVNAGVEVIVPLSNNVYEFFGDTGMERLVLNIRDPRLIQANQGNGQVYRQDMPGASYYAQSLVDGQLPSISQPIQILHSGK